jgi:hypothetical protein
MALSAGIKQGATTTTSAPRWFGSFFDMAKAL